ncbi:MAG: hypothetical protein ACXWF8_09200 [Methylobacter sp.]
MAIFLLMVFFGIGLAVSGWRSLIISVTAMFILVQVLLYLDRGSGGSGGAAGIGAIIIVFAGGLVTGTIIRAMILGLAKLKKQGSKS